MTDERALLAFLGAECPHCRRMEPVILAAERQIGRTFEKLEVWHDKENRTRMERVADALRDACGGVLGVPAFYNEATGEALCGEQDVDTLIGWATRTGGTVG